MHWHTRVLMSLSAACMAALGIGITFLPQELLSHFGAPAEGTVVLLVQVLGALYLGFAALNWMNRGSHLGGIYGRPIMLANFIAWAVAAVALLKGAIAQQFPLDITAMAAIHALFGVWFGLVLFTHPASDSRADVRHP
ncbi:MAG: hypothetical protein FJ191_06715 [Gammaproteobacteria bacterium]|nr:hypothetical protein [Gammaproteobacteria bacterium]